MAISFFSKNHNSNQNAVVIISNNENRLNYIKQVLSLKGTSEFILIHKDPLNVTPQDFSGNFWAVVIDGGNIDNEQMYIGIIKKIFPKDVACIMLGDNDSIKLYQKFIAHGITYLNYETQLNEVYQNLISFDKQESKNSAIKISVIGCKGGVGTSYVSYHLANLIKQRYLTPTILIQGVNSSFNIDILSGIKFDKDYFDDEKLNLYRETSDDSYHFDNPRFKDFNFAIFDHSVHSLEKEMIEHVLSNSDSVVLLSDNSIASVRKAKEILKINHFLKSVGQGVSKVLVCINNPSKYARNSLLNNEISELLEHKIDHTISFSKANDMDLGKKLSSKTKVEFEALVDSLTGAKANSKFKLFKGFR